MKISDIAVLLPLLYSSPAFATDYNQEAGDAINVLNTKWYSTSEGLWNNAWWESGNIITTIAKFGIQDPTFQPTASSIIANTYSKAANLSGINNWLNDYYDDEGWWALAWIAAYDLDGNDEYLDTAKYIFEDMTGGGSTNCSGGIYWRKERDVITSIANELFLSIAAHLANRVPQDEAQDYVDWATSQWDWFSNAGLINSDNVINDGLDITTCKNNGATVYTYNQGVILSGLAELAKATGDSTYTDAAQSIAMGAMKQLVNSDGILTEIGGAGLDEQGDMFKGVFVRGLAALQGQAPRQEYVDFLRKNAESMLGKDEDGEGVFGPNWDGAAQGNSTETSQASGVDLLVAAAMSC